MWFKKAYTWVADKWAQFEAWINSWLPGAKVRIISFLGVIGSAAAASKDWIEGTAPYLNDYITAKNVGIATAVLFTLTYWLRGIGDRVDARDAS